MTPGASRVIPCMKRRRSAVSDPAIARSNALLLEIVAGLLCKDDPALPNLVVLSGAVGEPPEPIRARRPWDEAAVGLMLDHYDPGKRARAREVKSCSLVQIPDTVLATYPGRIEKGDGLLVLGKVAGAGEILATVVVPVSGQPESLGNEPESRR
jgi:hypothetical protein